MKRDVRSLTKSSVLAAAAATLLAMTTHAQALDLSGKTVEWVVPFKEGGGSDTLARLLQPHLQEALPGNPTVIILNQPGGGSVTATNKFHATAATDGTSLLVVSTSTLVPVTLGSDKVKYDPTEWRAIMGVPRGTVLYSNPEVTGVTGKDPVADVKALNATPILHGLKNPTSAELLDLVTFELLGIDNVKAVFGLSTGKGRKAFLRGELTTNSDGTGPYLKKVKEAREAGKAAAVWSYGSVDASGKLGRDPDLPDVPTMAEVYAALNGAAPSGPGFDAVMNLMNNKVSLSKTIVLPKGTPDEIVDAYIETFRKIARIPEVEEGLRKSVGSMPIAFGEDVERALAAGTKMKPATREWIDNLLKTKYDASL